MEKFRKLLLSSGGVALLLVAIVAINIISSRLFVRGDLTQDDVYSLSDGTKSIIEKLATDVSFQLYFSRSSKELPVMIKTYATRVEEVLREYAARSGGRIKVEVYDPKPDSDEEVAARRYGISPVRLPSGSEMYFGVAMLFGGKDVAIPYLDPRREEFLEYDISEALLQAQTKDKMKIGVLSSLPVMGGGMDMQMPGMAGQQPSWALIDALRKSSELVEIRPDAKEIPDGVRVMLLIHPKAIPDALMYAIDQFVMNGGRLIAAVDPMSRVDLAHSGQLAQMSGKMPEAFSDLPKLFSAWDIEYKKDELVGDLKYTVRVNAGGVVTPYPFWMNLDDQVFSKNTPITSKLGSMLYAEGGWIKLKDGSPHKLEALISTSKESGSASAQMATFMGPADFAKELKADPANEVRVLAGLLTGKLKSAFSEGAPSESAVKTPHLVESKEDAAVVVIADTDFASDNNAVDRIQFGPQVILRPRNDNLNFLFNAIEFLGGSSDLISIRSRGRLARPFTRVQDLQVTAQKRYQQEEQKLSDQINELQKKLNDMQQQRSSGSQFSLSSEQQIAIENFRNQEKAARERRREVRKSLREDIEGLGKVLVAANMLIVPIGVGIFGVSVFSRRSRRTRSKN
jgi:ABC-type uncharacterized transport system involved in gliding motility auxiliary subunit